MSHETLAFPDHRHDRRGSVGAPRRRPRLDAGTGHTLFLLDIRGGRVVSIALEGSDVRVLVSGRSGTPDGVVVDTERGHIYWTIMGRPREDDGRIERVDLDGGNLRTIVPVGGACTPKQTGIAVVDVTDARGR